jgi:DNA-binding MarR family transcriptional regulator
MTTKILEYVLEHPGHTAYQISRTLGYSSDMVSSVLLGLYRRGKVTRWKPDDFRKGYEYGPVPKD